jgi:hypothetical protein
MIFGAIPGYQNVGIYGEAACVPELRKRRLLRLRMESEVELTVEDKSDHFQRTGDRIAIIDTGFP